MNLIEEQVANMTDAELAERCGGDNPGYQAPLPAPMGRAEMGELAVANLLQIVIGEDIKRGGLLETPARAYKAWQHWTKGYAEDPAEILKVFEDGAEGYNDMVAIYKIPFYSHCEHHLAPIIGHASVAYVPDGHIVGLSKLNRIVECFARRLQVQERLTVQIADALVEHLDPKGVAVHINARHLCMESRGICQQGHFTVTQRFRGCFAEDGPSWRSEFLAHCR